MFAGKLENSEVKFHKIDSGSKQYDPKYFGTYKSVVDGVDDDKFNYKDDRANLLKQKNSF